MSTEKLSKETLVKEKKWNEEEFLKREQFAKEMSVKIQITPNSEEEKNFILRLLILKVPLLSGFLQSLGNTGGAMTALIKSLGDTSQAVQGASSGFHFASLGIAAINFIRIPLIYFFSMIAGKWPPFTLSNNAKWAYSAVLLALALTGILVPAAAPPIGIAVAGLSLALSLYSIGNMIYKRQKIKKSINQAKVDIEVNEEILKDIRKKASLLYSELKAADTDEERIRICELIDDLQIEHKSTTATLQVLYNNKIKDEKTLEGLGTAAFMDRGVAAALTSLVIVGLVLSIFFPPVGLGIAAGSAGLGALYIVGRVGVSLIAPIIKAQWEKRKSQKEKTEDNQESPEPSPGLDESLRSQSTLSGSENERDLEEDSTLKTMKELFGLKATQRLKELKENAIEMDKLDNRLTQIVTSQNHREVLRFFQNISVIAHMEECPYGDLKCLFDKFTSINEALPLLETALEEVQNGSLDLSKKERETLYASEVFKGIIMRSAHPMDLSFLISSHQGTFLEDNLKGEGYNKSDF
ncbi:hypothetical protein [Legionella wadsworthii]|nr:hypothetical protein [Legionella wadsworthii]